MKTPACIVSFILFAILGAAHAQQSKEVAFSLQGGQLTWFEVADPSVQGILSATGLPAGFNGNALAYDPGANRLLFVSGPSATQHALYSLSLENVVLKANEAVSAGVVSSVGSIGFGVPQALFGGGFYNGSYYSLIDESDILVKVDFNGQGNISNTTQINLPGNENMQLGDLAFDSQGNLFIAGGINNNVNATTDRLWHYSTADGVNFVYEGSVNPPGVRYNGIFFGLEDDDLYGYRLAGSNPGEFGSIDRETGEISEFYIGDPFHVGGDLSNGILLQVIPEPSGALLSLVGGTLGLMRRRRNA